MPSVISHKCDSSTQDAETGGLWGQSGLCSEFQANLRYNLGRNTFFLSKNKNKINHKLTGLFWARWYNWPWLGDSLKNMFHPGRDCISWCDHRIKESQKFMNLQGTFVGYWAEILQQGWRISHHFFSFKVGGEQSFFEFNDETQKLYLKVGVLSQTRRLARRDKNTQERAKDSPR